MRTFAIAPIAAIASLLGSLVIGTQSRWIENKFPAVTVICDGTTQQLRTSASTVAELLDASDIILEPLDRTTPAPTAGITPGLTVRVTRVTRREVIETAVLPPRTIVLADPRRPVGYTKILTYGQDGLARRSSVVWEKDQQLTSKILIKERVLKPSADTVVIRGAHGLPSRGGQWRRPLRMEATAYDPGPRSCGKFADGYTAIGLKAEKGVVAVDPRVIPMRTRLYIPGYGFAIAGDRGSAIKGMRIDLCFPTYQEALEFGRKQMDVYILD